jgi:dihydroneopterin aldolase
MFSIYLKQLIFHSNHGWHEEEKKVKGTFEVNAEIRFSDKKNITDLNETLDYAAVYTIIQQKMQTPTPLLETVLQHVEIELKRQFPFIEFLFITIEKKNPPIIGFNGSVAVGITKHYLNP